MRPFQELLQESGKLHGHICPGQILGVRMAMLGCELAGVDDPVGSKSLIVYVEIDRCATDAIQAVTGCKLGKRTLKHVDYGKVAATFVNVNTDTAFRVVARDDSRDAVWKYIPAETDKKTAQFEAYKIMPNEVLFDTMRVEIDIPELDMPGHPMRRVSCDRCGEGVNDGREVLRDGQALCKACANGAYYRVSAPVISSTEAAL